MAVREITHAEQQTRVISGPLTQPLRRPHTVFSRITAATTVGKAWLGGSSWEERPETLEEAMLNVQQAEPSPFSRETVDRFRATGFYRDISTTRRPWQYPQKAALGLRAFRRSEAHLPVWLGSVQNGNRGNVTRGEAARAGPGAQAAEDEEWSSRGQTGRGEAPLCKALGEWRRGMVGTGGLGRKRGASTLSREGREASTSRRLSVGCVHDSLRQALSHICLLATPRTVARLLSPWGLSRQEY